MGGGTCSSGPIVNTQRMRPHMADGCWRGGLIRGGLLYIHYQKADENYSTRYIMSYSLYFAGRKFVTDMIVILGPNSVIRYITPFSLSTMSYYLESETMYILFS